MQDKREFKGGLNRDDDPRTLPNGDYFYAQNIRVLTSEDNSTNLVENVRGMESEVSTNDGQNIGVAGEHKVIGSYEDKPKARMYYFIWSSRSYHMILEYDTNTDLVTTVYRDVNTDSGTTLGFEKNTLITGVNKIGDVLYWTSDNPTIGSKGVTRHNEPKYLNVERSKTGWATYYSNGQFNSNPRTDYPLETSYPYEFYTWGDVNSVLGGTNCMVDSWRKRMYIDVCKTRPHPPMYIHQTPIKNISTGVVNFGDTSTFTMTGTETVITDLNGNTIVPATINPGQVCFENISPDFIRRTSELDFAYKKNNLYGHVWQFAYRYIYRDDEVGAYSEWSWVLPAPQYATNKVDEEKQQLYNQIRVYYKNGPADVKKIEIVARKCSYIETSPDNGNKGEFYLIATVDNNYYQSGFDVSTVTYSSLGATYYGWDTVANVNCPYINLLSTTGLEGNDCTLNGGNDLSSSGSGTGNMGFIDFRNDGVYTQVDPIAFDKLYDMVPKRAKAQEIIGENRLAYGNYIDGFDQVKAHYYLAPQYGYDEDAEYEGFALDESNLLGLGGGSFSSTQIEELNLTQANFGATPTTFQSWHTGDPGYGNYGESLPGEWEAKKAMCVDTTRHRLNFKIELPTTVYLGQIFHVKALAETSYHTNWGDGNAGYCFPHKLWSNNWPKYQYKQFGFQLDFKVSVGMGGASGLASDIKNAIEQICAGTYVDNFGQNTSEEEPFYNPNYGQTLNHLRRDEYGGMDEDQTHAEMKLYKIEQGTADWAEPGSNNKITFQMCAYGQDCSSATSSKPRCDRAGTDVGNNSVNPQRYPYYQWTMLDGTETTNIHVWRKSCGDDYNDATNCQTAQTFKQPGDDYCGCKEAIGSASSNNSWCGDMDDMATSSGWDACDGANGNSTNMEIDAFHSFNADMLSGGDVTAFAEEQGTNKHPSAQASDIDQVGAFKSGAWHRFGLVYYDHKGRSSTVMLNHQDDRDTIYDRNSSVYCAFPTEKKYKQQLADATFTDDATTNNPMGLTTTLLDNEQKKTPPTIAWAIFHRPPEWAYYYQWVYARNTSIGKFLQFITDAVYINKSARAGDTTGEGNADNKLYISLNVMNGRLWSYSEKDRSLIGEWSFAEGDRIRLISDQNSVVFDDPLLTNGPMYYDFKISEVGHFPGRFDYDEQQAIALDVAGDGTSSGVVLSPDSPAGGGPNDPASARPGKFIIVEDPKIPGMTKDDADSKGVIDKWSNVFVEIYRPKKNTNEDFSLYHEIGERLKIGSPRQSNRYHQGGIEGQNQNPNSFVSSTSSVYYNQSITGPATGVFKRGDIWYKPRDLETFDSSGNVLPLQAQMMESYFINDFMQTNHCNIGRPHIVSPNAREERREATITYSDVYQPDTKYNGFHSFNFAQRPYIDYDLTQGSIQKLVSRESNLVMIQENKCSTLMVGKNIINSPAGDEGLTLSTNVLPTHATPLAGDYGCCVNPESVAVFEKAIYFVDIRRGVACRIGGDGITVISNYKMVDFFRDKMDLYRTILPSEYDTKLGGGLFILGGYDRRHGEYVVTFPHIYSVTRGTEDRQLAMFDRNDRNFEVDSLREDGTEQRYDDNDRPMVPDFVPTAISDDDRPEEIVDGGREVTKAHKAETLSFNEKANRWSSFYTFYPDYYGQVNRYFISFKHGVLYKHDIDDVNHTFYYDHPIPEESQIRFPFNNDVSSVKTWNALTLEGADRQEVIPIVNTSTTGATSSLVATTGSANIVGTNVNFNNNDLAIGDSLWYNDNGTLRTLGVITDITGNTVIQTSISEVNAFIGASSTSSGQVLFNVFAITADSTMYKTDLVTNLNSSSLPHRTSYTNNATHAGTWVTREGVASTHIPYGVTESAGGEYYGLGNCTVTAATDTITGSSTEFTVSGVVVGDNVYYDNSGTETLIGTITAINNNTSITCPTSVNLVGLTFLYVKKNAYIEGDRLKGHYLDTHLKKRTKDKIHLYSANAITINSELTNK